MSTFPLKIGVRTKRKIVDEARKSLLEMLQQAEEKKGRKAEGKSGTTNKKRPVRVSPDRQIILNELCKDLREIRDRLKISQLELGKRIGTSQTAISKWEKGIVTSTIKNENELRRGLELLHKQLEKPNPSKERVIYKRNRTSSSYYREGNVYVIQRCTKCMRLSDRPCDDKCPITTQS